MSGRMRQKGGGRVAFSVFVSLGWFESQTRQYGTNHIQHGMKYDQIELYRLVWGCGRVQIALCVNAI